MLEYFALPLRRSATIRFLETAAGVLLFTVVSVNAALAVFNLLPIPPLDGFSVLQGLFSTIRARWARDATNFMDRITAQGPMLFMLLLFADRALPSPGIIWGILGPVHGLLMRLILNAGA